MKRTLTLRREPLTELSDTDLTGIRGGGIRITESGYSCGIRPCDPLETVFCQVNSVEGC